MWEKLKLLLSRAGSFVWPHLKKGLIAITPAIEAGAGIVVQVMADKYRGQLNTRIEKQAAHNDAFDELFNNAARYGIDIAAKGAEDAIDLAIKAAVTQLKGNI